MAYGNNPGPPGGMDSGGMDAMSGNSGMGQPETEEGMHDEGMEGEGALHIGPSDLPPGMKLNVGDIVEFKVTGPQDADGDWPIEYNYGEEGKGKGEEGTSWESDFRKEMSPRSGGGEDQQEPM